MTKFKITKGHRKFTTQIKLNKDTDIELENKEHTTQGSIQVIQSFKEALQERFCQNIISF